MVFLIGLVFVDSGTTSETFDDRLVLCFLVNIEILVGYCECGTIREMEIMVIFEQTEFLLLLLTFDEKLGVIFATRILEFLLFTVLDIGLVETHFLD